MERDGHQYITGSTLRAQVSYTISTAQGQEMDIADMDQHILNYYFHLPVIAIFQGANNLQVPD